MTLPELSRVCELLLERVEKLEEAVKNLNVTKVTELKKPEVKKTSKK